MRIVYSRLETHEVVLYLRNRRRALSFIEWNESVSAVWSGRGDLNARPPAPKEDSENQIRYCQILMLQALWRVLIN